MKKSRPSSHEASFLVKLLLWLLFVLLSGIGFLKSTDFPFWLVQ